MFNTLKENFDVAALSRHSQESEHWHHHFTQLWKTRAPCSVTCHNGTRNGTQFWLTGNEPLAFFLNQLFLMIFFFPCIFSMTLKTTRLAYQGAKMATTSCSPVPPPAIRVTIVNSAHAVSRVSSQFCSARPLVPRAAFKVKCHLYYFQHRTLLLPLPFPFLPHSIRNSQKNVVTKNS